jgi:hypothetical protein
MEVDIDLIEEKKALLDGFRSFILSHHEIGNPSDGGPDTIG